MEREENTYHTSTYMVVVSSSPSHVRINIIAQNNIQRYLRMARSASLSYVQSRVQQNNNIVDNKILQLNEDH